MTDTLSFFPAVRAADLESRAARGSEPAPQHRNLRERQKAIIRRRILDAAFDLFATKGVKTTTVAEIAEAADVAVGTFYRHFSSKADVALENWKVWLCDFVEALEVRPEREAPDQMLAVALGDLGALTFATAQRMPEDTEEPIPMSIMTLMFGDNSEDVAYRAYQLTAETEQALVVLFGRRLGFPVGALEPQIIASAFVASWRVAMGGFLAMAAAGLDPPTPDKLGLQCFTAYTEGLRHVWADRSGDPPD